MPVVNLQALADRTSYLTNEKEMNQEEAKTQALKEFGFDENHTLQPEVDSELNKLINNENMTDMSREGDKESLLDRSAPVKYEPYTDDPTYRTMSQQPQVTQMDVEANPTE